MFTYLQSNDQWGLPSHQYITAGTSNVNSHLSPHQSVQSSPQPFIHNHNQKLPSFNEVMTSKAYYRSNGQNAACQNNNNSNIDNKNNLGSNGLDIRDPLALPVYKSFRDRSDHSYSKYPPVNHEVYEPVAIHNMVSEISSIIDEEQSLTTAEVTTTTSYETSERLSYCLNKAENVAVPINSDDIMNMDIIFEDMPTQEEQTNSIAQLDVPEDVDTAAITYEIIPVDDENQMSITDSLESDPLYQSNSLHTDSIATESAIKQRIGLYKNMQIKSQNSSVKSEALVTHVDVEQDEKSPPPIALIKSEIKTEENIPNPLPPLKRKNKLLPVLVDRNKKLRRMNENNVAKESELLNEVNKSEAVSESSNKTAENLELKVESSSNDNPDNEDIVDNENRDASPSTSGENNFMDSLVVVESQDPNDPSRTIHEVYVVCPRTKQLSEQPLDLPDDVIQKIRMSLNSNS